MHTIPTTRLKILAPLLGIAAAVLLSAAAVVIIALFPEDLPSADAAPLLAGPAAQVAPDTRSGAPLDTGEAGYPALSLDENGNPIACWYFEEGTRDHIGYNIFS